MNKEEFYFLYVNANCLAELALKAASQELESLLNGSEPINLEQALDSVPESLDELDFSAVEGLGMYDIPAPSSEADPSTMEASLKTMDKSFKVVEAELADIEQESNVSQIESELSALSDEPFDLGLYLERAYAQRDLLQDRIDKAFILVDRPQIEALIQALPSNFPSMLGELSVEQMDSCKAFYMAEQPNLIALVAQVCALNQIE